MSDTPRIEILRGRMLDWPRHTDEYGLVFYGPDDYLGLEARVPCGGCDGWGRNESGKCISCNGVGYYFTLPFDACEVCHGASLGVPGNENIIDGKVLCDYCSAKALIPGGDP